MFYVCCIIPLQLFDSVHNFLRWFGIFLGLATIDFSFLFQFEATSKEKNLLPLEQILSFKS